MGGGEVFGEKCEEIRLLSSSCIMITRKGTIFSLNAAKEVAEMCWRFGGKERE